MEIDGDREREGERWGDRVTRGREGKDGRETQRRGESRIHRERNRLEALRNNSSETSEDCHDR